MEWTLRVVYRTGVVKVETFDSDEIGTLDDILTGFFITDLQDIEAIKITRLPKER